MSCSFHCPACLTSQALYPNVVAPGPDNGVYVLCTEPDCEAIAVHHPVLAQVEQLREWARRVVAADIENVCRAVAREGSR